MELVIFEPVIVPGSKSSPYKKLLISLLPETEFRDKSAKVTPA